MDFCCVRRRFSRDVHDGRPEEVLRGDEEDGQQKASQSYTETKGKTFHNGTLTKTMTDFLRLSKEKFKNRDRGSSSL